MRSKAHWGYSAEFMDACRDELTCSADDIVSPDTAYLVAELAGRVAGYAALVRLDPQTADLEAMFVEPEMIGSGVGKVLMREIVSQARDMGVRRILIQADPNAAEFYAAAGATRCGERESDSVPGRMLPLYRLDV
ncbi:MAG: GNAT family N-acetyltransferase [Gammaproteobacteria bacterium]|nr:GNAT family N-acetyltransferase [Gammaproteobacteria bacterium]